MRKLSAISLFPVIWITSYLYRIVYADLICGIVQIAKNLFTNFGLSLFLLVTLPFVLAVDVLLGFIVTCANSVSICEGIIDGELNFWAAFKTIFYNNKTGSFF